MGRHGSPRHGARPSPPQNADHSTRAILPLTTARRCGAGCRCRVGVGLPGDTAEAVPRGLSLGDALLH